MKAKLVVVGGDAKAAEIKLRLPTVIGRGREADLHLPHPLVSRQHCQIFEQGNQLFVRDLGSLNGTFVGNERVDEAPLPSGELLTVGTVTFRAVYESESGLSPPPRGEAPARADKTSIARRSSDTICDPAAGTVEAPAPGALSRKDEREDSDSAATPELPPPARRNSETNDDGELNRFLRGLG